MPREHTRHPFLTVAEAIDPTPHPYAGRPVEWVEEVLREPLWSAEREIMRAVNQHRYTAVKSAHSQGKSFSAARVVAHWIETHKPGEAFAVTTAPSDALVKAVLWKEIGRAHGKGKLVGRVLQNAEWKMPVVGGYDELVGYGRKPSDTNAAGLFGTHARYVLVVIDEAGAIPKPIFDGVDGLTTNAKVHVLAIGNPDDPAAHFATICKPGSGWHVMTLDGLRSPNFTAEAVAKYPRLRQYMISEGIPPATEEVADSLRDLLLDPIWVDERLKRWGQSSPMFISRVRGRFPQVAIDTLIEPRWVLAAQNREAAPVPSLARFGVDVARNGPDHSIIVKRQGPHARVICDIPKGPTTGVSGEIVRFGNEHSSVLPVANVDADGVGGGVVDELVEARYPVLPLNGGSTKGLPLMPNGVPRFPNCRSWWWWQVREALAGPSGTGEDGYLDLDPEDEDLAAQLLAVKYRVNSRGQIVVETKDQMAERGLPSPDRADALAYSLVRERDEGHVVTSAMVMRDLPVEADDLHPMVAQW
jgi:hypothetical protein